MTVAGIAVLEICLQALPANLKAAARAKKHLAKAWQWLARQESKIGSPNVAWTYYFHYGLERAAVLSGKTKVGTKDWYEAGVKMLLEQQHAGGGWGPNIYTGLLAGTRKQKSSPIQTAFAILFLRRKFKQRLQPITVTSAFSIRDLKAQASAKLIRLAVKTEVRRGVRAVPALIKFMQSSLLVRRKAGALALHAITHKDFGFDPNLEPGEADEAIKEAERWWMTVGRKKL